MTQIIFNTSPVLKKAIAKKARSQGLTVSHVLNLAAQAYVENQITIGAFDARLATSVEEADAGRLLTVREVRTKLGL